MLIGQILEAKPSQVVFRISQNATVSDAVDSLAAKGVGALLVSEDGKSIDGIISERDIIREIGSTGAECLTRPVHSVMTSKITSCSTSDSAEQALQLMTQGRFRHLPVMRDDELIGMISIGDVVKARIDEVQTEKGHLEDMIRGY